MVTDPDAVRTELLAYALTYPDAHIEYPWGETVVKVGKRVFAFFGVDGEPASGLTVKLPESAPVALQTPGVAPSGYGLGKAGWCRVALGSANVEPELLREWIDESYRAVCLQRHRRILDAG